MENNFFSYLVTLFGLLTGIYLLFNRFDGDVSPKLRQSTINWLNNLNNTKITFKWPQQFLSLFEKVFDKKPFSKRMILRSFLISIITAFLILLIWATLRQNEFNEFFLHHNKYARFGYFLMSLLSINLIADYISILETRFILLQLTKTKSKSKTVFLLLFDIVLTLFIFFIFGFIFLKLFYIPNIWGEAQGKPLFKLIKDNVLSTLTLSVSKNGFLPHGVLFYTNFFTSIWLYLYLIGSGIVKLILKIASYFVKFPKFFNVIEKPFTTIGYFLMLLITILYMIFIAYLM